MSERSSSSSMQRRQFIRNVSATGIVATGLAGCAGNGDGDGGPGDDGGTPSPGDDGETTTQPSTDGSDDEDMDIGVILSSPADDLGWSQKGITDIRNVADEFGWNVNDVAETVAFGDYADTLNDIVTNNDIIISHSNGYLNSGGMDIIGQYPDKRFMFYHTPVVPDLPENTMNYVTGLQQGHLILGGYAAGLLTQVDTVGIVASLPVQAIIGGIRGAICGVKRSNPEAEILDVPWMNAFYDPETERQMTESLLDNGADVIVHVSNSAVPGRVVEERDEEDIWALGAFMDQSVGAPDGFASSHFVNHKPFFQDAFDAIQTDTWNDFRGGFENAQAWAPEHYDNCFGFVYQGEEDNFHPDIPDDVASMSNDFADTVNAFEDPDIQFPLIWEENECPDGTTFEFQPPT